MRLLEAYRLLPVNRLPPQSQNTLLHLAMRPLSVGQMVSQGV